jgi:hypothetical protein
MRISDSSLVSLTFLAFALSLAGCGDSSPSGTGGSGGMGGTGGTGGAGGTGGTGGAGGTGGTTTPTISVGGIAWGFTLPGQGGYDRIANATISVLEMPELSTTSNTDGEFTIAGIPVGSEATFVLEQPSYPLTYTKTFTIPDTDIDNLTFQIPNKGLYSVIEIQLGITSDPEKCQMVSTFTRVGRTIGDPGPHGQAGAVLTIAPANAVFEEGPIYFGDNVVPDRSRTYSSLDGGVLIVNADPGDYTLTAACVTDPGQKAALLAEYPPADFPDEDLRCETENVPFETVMMKCRAGVFVNASPSYGLQALP